MYTQMAFSVDIGRLVIKWADLDESNSEFIFSFFREGNCQEARIGCVFELLREVEMIMELYSTDF